MLLTTEKIKVLLMFSHSRLSGKSVPSQDNESVELFDKSSSGTRELKANYIINNLAKNSFFLTHLFFSYIIRSIRLFVSFKLCETSRL